MSLAVAFGSSAAWSPQQARLAAARGGYAPLTMTYNLSDAFCGDVRRKFVDDAWFSWHSIECRDVRAMVRQAFDGWEHNTLLGFVETTGRAVDITVDTAKGSGNALGWAWIRPSAVEIDVSSAFCWYTDRAFCDSVRELYIGLFFFMGVSWAGALALLLYVCWRPATTAVDAVTRIVAWAILLAQPLAAAGIYPCFRCYDLLTVLTHEVGHAIGMRHSDDATATTLCGCQNDTRACPASPDTANVMHSTFHHRSTACLSRDDVDGARTLWGGRCDDPVWCYALESRSGFYRLHTSLLYSFVFAWLVVLVRTLARRHRARSGHRVAPLRRRAVELNPRSAARLR